MIIITRETPGGKSRWKVVIDFAYLGFERVDTVAATYAEAMEIVQNWMDQEMHL